MFYCHYLLLTALFASFIFRVFIRFFLLSSHYLLSCVLFAPFILRFSIGTFLLSCLICSRALCSLPLFLKLLLGFFSYLPTICCGAFCSHPLFLDFPLEFSSSHFSSPLFQFNDPYIKYSYFRFKKFHSLSQTTTSFSLFFTFASLSTFWIHKMPCRFIGLFYIQDCGRTLTSYFLNEHAVPRTLNINYFRDVKDADSSPFPEIYTNIAHSKVYLIIGTFFHRPSEHPIVSFQTIFICWFLL